MLSKVISGGQTGAERAALEAALELGIKTGGCAPLHYMTAAGPDTSLFRRYGLLQVIPNNNIISVAESYRLRSRVNVDMSDGTVVFKCYHSKSLDRTIEYCRNEMYNRSSKPVIIISRAVSPSIDKISNNDVSVIWRREATRLRKFIIQNNIRTLNIRGNIQNNDIDPGWYFRVKLFLLYTFSPILK